MAGTTHADDFALSRVPLSARKAWFPISVQRFGQVSALSQFLLGSTLGYSMTFTDAFLAILIGSIIIEVIMCVVGIIAQREGLNTALLARWTGFGEISGQNAYFTGSITASVRNASTILIAKNLADELAGTGVTVNVVNPGLVTTTPGAEVATGRGGESSPEQIADLIAFLSSSRSVVSGESISISHRVLGSTLL